MLEAKIDAELKAAMLAGDQERVSVLRGVKSSIFYEAIKLSKKDSGLSEDELLKVLQSEAKKRSDSAAIYNQNGASEQASKELKEKAVIEEFLPKQLGPEELAVIVKSVIEKAGSVTQADMGKLIGAVKQEVGGSADGSSIAAAVREHLIQK